MDTRNNRERNYYKPVNQRWKKSPTKGSIFTFPLIAPIKLHNQASNTVIAIGQVKKGIIPNNPNTVSPNTWRI